MRSQRSRIAYFKRKQRTHKAYMKAVKRKQLLDKHGIEYKPLFGAPYKLFA